MSPKEVLEFAKKNDVKQLDLRFTDIPSLQHHVSYPINELDEDSFENGFGMDGSSIRGWAGCIPVRALLPQSDYRWVRRALSLSQEAWFSNVRHRDGF